MKLSNSVFLKLENFKLKDSLARQSISYLSNNLSNTIHRKFFLNLFRQHKSTNIYHSLFYK